MDKINFEPIEFEPIEETPVEEVKKPEVSKLQSLAQGAGSGASLGLGDVLSGALGATFGRLSSEDQASLKRQEEMLKAIQQKASEKILAKDESKLSPEQLERNLELYKSLQADMAKKPESEKSWKDRYYEAKSLAKETREAAAEANPLTYGVGTLAGSIPVGLGMGTAGGAANLVKEGIKAGAITGAATGFGEGEAKLLEGDISGTAGETLSGGAIGGLLGGAVTKGLTSIPKAVKSTTSTLEELPGVKQLITTPLKYGLENKFLSGKNVAEDVRKLGEETVEGLTESVDKLNTFKSNLAKYADDLGVRFDVSAPIEKQIAEVAEGAKFGKGHESAKNTLLEELKSIKSYEDSIVDKVKDKIEQKAIKAEIEGSEKPISTIIEKEGRPVGISATTSEPSLSTVVGKKLPENIGDIENLTVKDLTSLKERINDLAKIESKNPAGNAEAIQVYRTLGKEIGDIEKSVIGEKTGMQGIPEEISERIHNMLNAMEKAGIKDNLAVGKAADLKEKVSKMESFLGRPGGEATKGARDIRDFLNYVRESDSTLADKLEKKITSTRDVLEALPGSSSWNLIAPWTWGKYVSNVTGLGYAAARDAIPTQLKDLSQKLASHSNQAFQQYAAPLLKAATESEQKRNAILFGLMQQPAFREAVKSLSYKPESKE